MSAEHGDPRDDAWLRGLSGAPADGAPSADFAAGRRLRAGLDGVPEVALPPAGWAEVVARADQAQQATAAPRPARNDAHWTRAGAAAAVLVLVVGVWQLRSPPADVQWRGESGAVAPVAQWVSADAPADAARLAADLQAWGARVERHDGAEASVVLDIRCPAPCDARVAQRLAELETALDPSGQLRLQVRQGR